MSQFSREGSSPTEDGLPPTSELELESQGKPSNRRNPNHYTDIKHKYFSRLRLGAPEAGRAKPISASRGIDGEANLPFSSTLDGEISSSVPLFHNGFPSSHSLQQHVSLPNSFSSNSPPIAIPAREQTAKRDDAVVYGSLPSSLPRFSLPQQSLPPATFGGRNMLGFSIANQSVSDPASSWFSPLACPQPLPFDRSISWSREETSSNGTPEALSLSTALSTPFTSPGASSRGTRTHSSPTVVYSSAFQSNAHTPFSISSHSRMTEREKEPDLFDFEQDQDEDCSDEPVAAKPARSFEDYFDS